MKHQVDNNKNLEVIRLYFRGRCRSKDNQKRGTNKGGQYFVRKEFQEYEKSVKAQAINQMGSRELLTMPLFVVINFYFNSKTRPDLFNAPKSLLDALKGIVYKDDRQIIMGFGRIIYDDRERVEMVISTCEEVDLRESRVDIKKVRKAVRLEETIKAENGISVPSIFRKEISGT